MKKIICLVLLVNLSSCYVEETPYVFNKNTESASDVTTGQLVQSAIQPSIGARASNKRYTFAFWYEGEVPQGELQNEDTMFDGHQCGIVHFLSVGKIPDFSDDPLHDTDTAFEYDDEGQEVRRWRLPVDEQILGIDGNMLLIGRKNKPLLGILPDGSIIATELKNGQIDQENIKHQSCPPALNDILADSSYRICTTLPEYGSQKQRHLLYETPCT